jgi:hypothetical protein
MDGEKFTAEVVSFEKNLTTFYGPTVCPPNELNTPFCSPLNLAVNQLNNSAITLNSNFLGPVQTDSFVNWRKELLETQCTY